MHKGIVEKSFVLIVKIGLYASLLVPFVVTKFTLYPYIFGRAIFFQILIEALIPLWVALLAFYPEYRPRFVRESLIQPSRRSGRPSVFIWRRYGTINTAIVLWTLALLISAIFSMNPVRSFWGTMERMTGVYTILHFALFYFMLISAMKTWRDLLWFLRSLTATGAIVSGYILYQAVIMHRMRPEAWFGNPGIAGTFLLFFVFLIPIAWLFERKASQTKRRMKTVLFVACEILTLIAIIYNSTRAVWVGIFVSFLVGIWFIPSRLGRLSRWGYIGAGSICLSVAVFVMILVTGQMPKPVYAVVPFLERVHNLNDPSRLFAWKAGIKSFSDRPIFGYGLGNFAIPFNKQYDPIVATFSPLNVGYRFNFDQAHNQPLEYLVTTGILGFGAYAVLVAISLFLLWKGRDKTANILVSLLIIAYIAHSFFTFDTPSSFFLLMIVLWVAHYLCSIRNTPSKEKNALQNAFLVIVCAIVVPTTLFLFVLNIKSVLASHNAAIALAAINAKANTATKWYFLKKAVDYRSSYSFDIAEEIGDDFIDSVEEYASELESIAPVLIGILEKQSHNEWHRLILIARLHTFLCQKDTAHCRTALSYLERAKILAPNRFQIYSGMYVAYNNIAEYGQARDAIERAIELGYIPRALPILTNLGFLYGKLGEYKKSSLYYEQALALNPGSRDVLSSLVAVFAKNGDIQKAREYAKRLFVVDPERKKFIEQFLNDQ